MTVPPRALQEQRPPPSLLSHSPPPGPQGLCSLWENLHSWFGSRLSTNKNANVVVQIISQAFMRFTPSHY